MLVGVKFCGGCRASYDRRAEADRLVAAAAGKAAGGQGVVPVDAEAGGRYDVLLVVCGCKARCPDTGSYSYKDAIYVDGPDTEAGL